MCLLNSLHPAFELVRSERVSALGITGILCQGGDVYMQVLEGSREAVNTLYNRIVRAARRDPVTLLQYTGDH